MLMWKSHAMSILFPKGDPWQFVLKEDEDGSADWTIAVEDQYTTERLEEERVGVEVLSACIMKSPACRP